MDHTPPVPDPDESHILDQPVVAAFATLFHRLTLLVSLVGCILSLWMFVLWVRVSLREFASLKLESTKELIHSLLTSVELLLLVPLPAIIAIVVQKILGNIVGRSSTDLDGIHRQVDEAKAIIAGFLITVTGTTLLDYLITGEAELDLFIGGALIMAGLSFYIFASKKGS
jgi:hypothetical protein